MKLNRKRARLCDMYVDDEVRKPELYGEIAFTRREVRHWQWPAGEALIKILYLNLEYRTYRLTMLDDL